MFRFAGTITRVSVITQSVSLHVLRDVNITPALIYGINTNSLQENQRRGNATYQTVPRLQDTLNRQQFIT